MFRKVLIITLCVFIIIGSALYVYGVYQRAALADDIKAFAEKKVSELFQANVQIGAIQFGFLKYISLSKLQIKQKLSARFFYLVDIKKVIFNYQLGNIFDRTLHIPNEISFYAPRFEFNQLRVPLEMFGHNIFKKKNPVVFRVRDGSLSYAVPTLATQFLLKAINGQVIPRLNGAATVNFSAEGSGDLSGAVYVGGAVNNQDKTCDLDIFLENIGVTSASFAPVRELNGKLHITRDAIRFDNISFLIRDARVNMNGTIEGYTDEKRFDVHVSVEMQQIRIEFTLFDTFDSLKIKGSFSLGKFHYTFASDIVLHENAIQLENMIINDKYTAQGKLFLDRGIYSITVHSGAHEIHIEFSHIDYTMQLDLKLEHIRFLDYDFVVVGRIRLEPQISFWRENKFVFNGIIDTDYMIFNFMPMDDFEGTFTFSDEGISDVHLQWGEVYALSGSLGFDKGYILDGDLTVTDLDVQKAGSFGQYVVPNYVEGTIQSRVKFSGSAENPQIEGYMRSGPGRFKQFEFKKTKINFFGNRHLLTLYDSEIFRSSSVFYLRGNIDFSKSNIFHNLVIESSEKLILWHGWDVSKNVTEDSVHVKKKVADNVDLNLRGILSNDKDNKTESQGAVALDYSYEGDQRISLAFEEDKDDERVSVKHTTTF